MKRWAVLAALVACAPAPTRALPGASLGPKLTARFTATRACGDDIAFDGHASPDLRFSYAFDALGRVAGATGTYTASADTDTIVYTYDNLGSLSHSIETDSPGTSRVEYTYDYDTLEQLADYIYSYATVADGSDTQVFAMSAFTTAGQPTVEVITDSGFASHFALSYDDQARLVRTVADDDSVTTYTYDDDARTLAVVTDDGAYYGNVTYDDDARELSEQWGGSASDAPNSRTTYRYASGTLLDVTYEIGSAGDTGGSDLHTAEVDTLRYCASPP